jgi:cytochrome c-type biogenesis protein CcmH/NrfF
MRKYYDSEGNQTGYSTGTIHQVFATIWWFFVATWPLAAFAHLGWVKWIFEIPMLVVTIAYLITRAKRRREAIKRSSSDEALGNS